jgi:translocation and assembly module TamB
MSRRARILRNAGIGVAAFVAIAAIAAILVVRTDRFREYVRQKIIIATEDGTGGRVELGSFTLDWTHLSATITDLVIHGNEPAGSAPYLRAGRVEIHLRLFTSFKRLLDIAYLGVDRPQANILVFPDGSTNVPRPKQASSSRKPPLQTVVDLAVGRFDLAKGSVTFNSQKQDFDLRGESLRVQLWYDLLKQGYKGEISMAPLYVVSGRNTPVKFVLTLPVTLGRDRIALQNGRVTTDQSQLLIAGVLDNLSNPRISAHIQGRVALADLKNAANLKMALNNRGIPAAVEMDVSATVGENEIDMAPSWIALGGSRIEASGKPLDKAGNGALQFAAHLAVGELGRLAKMEMRPEGAIQVNGVAKIDAQRNYDVQGHVEAKGLSLQQGAQRIRDITLATAAHLTPHRLDLNGLRVEAFGAEIDGSASLEDFARYAVSGNLRHLDLQTAMRDMGQKGAGYDGTVSGSLEAKGDLSAPGASSVMASARLTIAPAHRGIPVSGRVYADYRGDADNLNVTDSYIALPHSRVSLSGSLGSRLNVTFTTRDFRDFSPVVGGPPPIVLTGGRANFAGVLTGRPTSPQITGHFAMDHFSAQGRRFDALSGDVAASSSRVAISATNLQRGAMQAQLKASVGLQDWRATQNQPLSAEASIRNGDLADALALSGVSPEGYSGALTAEVNVSGALGNPRGAANLTVTNGTIRGEPIDILQAQINLADQLVTVSNARLAAGQSRIALTAEFHHPRERFDRGQLHAHMETSQVDLARLRTVQNLRPRTAGILQASADLSGELRDSDIKGGTEFQPTNVTADASGRGLEFDGQSYGDFTGSARTNGQAVAYDVSSNFAGARIRVNGTTQLAAGYRTNADANLSGLPIERVLALLKRTDIPARGALAATVHFAGTMDRPEGNLDATIDHGAFYDESIDRVHARLNYSATSIEAPQLEIRAGNASLEASARYDHPAGVFGQGNLQFRIAGGPVDLSRIRSVQKVRPGMAGTLQLTANGAATVRDAEPRVLARDLNFSFAGKAIAFQGKNFGDATLTGHTDGGRLNFALDSNLASASIQGKGSAQLSGDYPLQAQVTFHNITWKGLQPLLASAGIDSGEFDAATDGEITINCPVLQTNALNGRLQLSRVQVSATAASPRSQTVTIMNEGPVGVALDHGVARIESLHLTGPQTDIQARGAVSFTAQTMEVSLNAHTDLSLIQRFRHDVTSSGQLTADVTARGAFANPRINGNARLQDASVNVADFSAGLSNANGAVEFNGSSASFQNLTGEVGGGKVTLSGFFSYSDAIRLGLRVNATKVRMRLQPGVSAIADADLK